MSGSELDGDQWPLLMAILVLLLHERPRRVGDAKNVEKPEVLLSRAGLTHVVIAQTLGKQPEAVKKAIQRSKARSTGGST